MDDAPADAPSSGLSIRDLEAKITELAGHLNAANHRWLLLIAEFDRRRGWSDGFTHSCAHWLSWKCGLDLGAAREKVRVARALEPLPRISAAMACGRLSYSKVRALTRVATPETEEVLLNVALHGTTHHVETLVRQFRRVQEVQELEREAQQYAQRGLTYFHDADGSLVVKLRLTAEGGAVFLKAMAAALPEIPLPRDDDGRKAANSMGSAEHRQPALHVSAETRCALPGSRTFDGRVPTPAARRADALVVLAESFLQFGVAAMKGGDRHQIVVHVDDCTLRRGEAGRCELDEGPGIPVQTARRLACDASIVTITEDERGDPLDVGRKTRSIPPALRRALASRDKGCVFPGCTHTRYVDGHHIRHWADGGETRLSNLVTLCRFHHRAVHEGGLQVMVPGDSRIPAANRCSGARRGTPHRWRTGRRWCRQMNNVDSRSARARRPPAGAASAWITASRSTRCCTGRRGPVELHRVRRRTRYQPRRPTAISVTVLTEASRLPHCSFGPVRSSQNDARPA